MVTLSSINHYLSLGGLPNLTPQQSELIQNSAPKDKIINAVKSLPDSREAKVFLLKLFTENGIYKSADSQQPRPQQQQAQQPRPQQQQVGEVERFSIHVYGGKAALCFDVDETKSQFPTIALDAALAIGERQYDWGKKIRVQLTRAELPVVAAAMLGVIPSCEFKNHGPDKSKGFAIEKQQGGRVFVKVFANGEKMRAVPIEASDVFYVVSLFVRQLQKSSPWLDSTSIMGMIRATQAK